MLHIIFSRIIIDKIEESNTYVNFVRVIYLFVNPTNFHDIDNSPSRWLPRVAINKPNPDRRTMRHIKFREAWWRHQMETFSALLALRVGNSPVTGEFPHKGQWRGALMSSLICALNGRLSKQSVGWWFETPSRSLWRHCNGISWRQSGVWSVVGIVTT